MVARPRLLTQRRLLRLATLVIAVAAIAFVVSRVPLHDRCAADGRCETGLLPILARANIPLVALVTVLSLSTTLVWAWRWRNLVALAKIDVSLLHVWRLVLESQAASLLLPGGIGGDAVRIGGMVGRGAPAATVVASVVLDRAVGLATLAFASAAAMLAIDGPSETAAFVASIPLAFVLGLVALRRPALRDAGWLRHGFLGRTVQPILGYLGDPGAPRAIAKSVVAGVVTSAMQVATARALLYAAGGAPTNEAAFYAAFVGYMVVVAVPAAPGGWGTGEAALVVLLARAGIPASTALATSLLFRLGAYLSGVVGAVLFLFRRSGRPERGGGAGEEE